MSEKKTRLTVNELKRIKGLLERCDQDVVFGLIDELGDILTNHNLGVISVAMGYLIANITRAGLSLEDGVLFADTVRAVAVSVIELEE